MGAAPSCGTPNREWRPGVSPIAQVAPPPTHLRANSASPPSTNDQDDNEASDHDVSDEPTKCPQATAAPSPSPSAQISRPSVPTYSTPPPVPPCRRPKILLPSGSPLEPGALAAAPREATTLALPPQAAFH
ncbi:hypothetical protein ACHHYP_01785 [Achlya hypogyna]|uniref:Uncharacterized protein n=1 Tax=Achlya hypogyna TaxID=1202772 RepID=A0A1V9ZT50_ACHHY|nr:hypothetical protein ACHHYP_01785 [Achlya hypogyna]